MAQNLDDLAYILMGSVGLMFLFNKVNLVSLKIFLTGYWIPHHPLGLLILSLS